MVGRPSFRLRGTTLTSLVPSAWRRGKAETMERKTPWRGEHGAGKQLGAPRRIVAKRACHRLDDAGRRGERFQVLAAEDEHQARGAARLIIRRTVASSTSSPRWLVTSCL